MRRSFFGLAATGHGEREAAENQTPVAKGGPSASPNVTAQLTIDMD